MNESPIATFLKNRHEPCPACGYDLCDTAGEACPECGLGLRLQLAPRESAGLATIAGASVISAGLGFSLLLWVVMIIAYVLEWGNGPGVYRIHLALAAGVVLGAVCLAIWVRLRARLQRASPRRRWLLVLACLAAPLANLAAASLVIFVIGI